MRALCVSDLHVAGPECPRQQAFLRFLAASRGQCDLLCLCGDVFEHWWHWPGPAPRPFLQYAEVVEALRPFRLCVLPGNHDWAAPAFFAQHLDAAVPGPDGVLRTTWDGASVVLAHGDQADRSPGYRAVTATLRGPAFTALLNALSPPRAWTLLGRLAGHGDVRPNPALIAAQQDWALAQGADLVIHGHTHAPDITEVVRGSARTLAVNIGDGVRHGTFVDYDSRRADRVRLAEFASPLHAAP